VISISGCDDNQTSLDGSEGGQLTRAFLSTVEFAKEVEERCMIIKREVDYDQYLKKVYEELTIRNLMIKLQTAVDDMCKEGKTAEEIRKGEYHKQTPQIECSLPFDMDKKTIGMFLGISNDLGRLSDKKVRKAVNKRLLRLQRRLRPVEISADSPDSAMIDLQDRTGRIFKPAYILGSLKSGIDKRVGKYGQGRFSRKQIKALLRKLSPEEFGEATVHMYGLERPIPAELVFGNCSKELPIKFESGTANLKEQFKKVTNHRHKKVIYGDRQKLKLSQVLDIVIQAQFSEFAHLCCPQYVPQRSDA